MRPPVVPVGPFLFVAASFHNAAAQSPQFVPAYPLYCQGPLTTSAPSGGETTTPFHLGVHRRRRGQPGAGTVRLGRPGRREGVEIQSAAAT